MPILPHVPKWFNRTSLVMIYLRQRVVSRPFTDSVQIYPHIMQWYSTACIQHTNILLEPKFMKPLDKTVKLFCFLFSLLTSKSVGSPIFMLTEVPTSFRLYCWCHVLFLALLSYSSQDSGSILFVFKNSHYSDFKGEEIEMDKNWCWLKTHLDL